MGEWRNEPLIDCLAALIDHRGKSPPKSDTGIPVLSAKVVKTTGFLRPIEQTIAPEYYPVWMTRGLPQPGDVVMTTEAPMGEVIQLDEETSKFARKLDNTFLRYLLTSPKQQEILASYATGTTVLGISQKALRSMPIPFPCFDEQQEIGRILVSLDEKIELNRRTNETLEMIDEEIAFYDALAENESARDMMGEPALRLIAHELMQTIKDNVTVDWMHRDPTRANIRRLVKRILRKHGYPPDLQEAAVQNVLQQAEALSAQFAEA